MIGFQRVSMGNVTSCQLLQLNILNSDTIFRNIGSSYVTNDCLNGVMFVSLFFPTVMWIGVVFVFHSGFDGLMNKQLRNVHSPVLNIIQSYELEFRSMVTKRCLLPYTFSTIYSRVLPFSTFIFCLSYCFFLSSLVSVVFP